MRAADAGLTIRIDNDRLVVRGPRCAAPIARQVLAQKALVAEVLKPGIGIHIDAATWRALHGDRLAYWRSFHSDEEASMLAWGDLEWRWHLRHGERTPDGMCVGCRQLLDGSKTLALGDGNIIHFEGLQCLLDFGQRWRDAAAAALQRMGLQPPDRCRT
jgi:hypothetical protein